MSGSVRIPPDRPSVTGAIRTPCCFTYPIPYYGTPKPEYEINRMHVLSHEHCINEYHMISLSSWSARLWGRNRRTPCTDEENKTQEAAR